MQLSCSRCRRSSSPVDLLLFDVGVAAVHPTYLKTRQPLKIIEVLQKSEVCTSIHRVLAEVNECDIRNQGYTRFRLRELVPRASSTVCRLFFWEGGRAGRGDLFSSFLSFRMTSPIRGRTKSSLLKTTPSGKHQEFQKSADHFQKFLFGGVSKRKKNNLM